MGDDSGSNPEDHRDDSQANKDGVDRDKGAVTLDRLPTQLGGDVLGRCSTSAGGSRRGTPTGVTILRVSLIVQDDVMHAEAPLLNLSSLQRQTASVPQVDWTIAFPKQVR